MKLAIIAAAGAALLATANPALAAELAPGEIALDIEVTAFAVADYAVVEGAIAVVGTDERSVEADLREQEAAVVQALAELGIGKGKIVFGAAELSQQEPIASYGELDIIAADGTIADDLVGDDLYVAGMPSTWQATASLTVTVDDLESVGEVAALATDKVDYLPPNTSYVFHDVAASKRAAIVDAVTKARSEADAYAQALGYKVIRIVGASNRGPEQDFVSFLAQMMALGQPRRGEAMLSREIVNVTVEYALAPQ